jgi:hypothetical protein
MNFRRHSCSYRSHWLAGDYFPSLSGSFAQEVGFGTNLLVI